MRNKLIFLIAVFLILFTLILVIKKNRSTREKVRTEEKIQSDKKQHIEDSLRNIESLNNNNVIVTNQNDNNNVRVPHNTTGMSKTSTERAVAEDYSKYINSSIIKTGNNNDVCVTIVDENKNISSPISSSIANIYKETGRTGKTGLLKSSFIDKSGFQELLHGNSEIIERLKLSSHTDYIALGKIQYTMRKGSLVDGTIVCTASLTMTIISATQKSILKSFSCSSNGNGVTENQAQEEATQKLISKYYNDYSTL